jgi:hypothetical protein
MLLKHYSMAVPAAYYPAPRWLQYYRYVTPAEAYAVATAHIIATFSPTGRTWYTPDRYATRDEARTRLALPVVPSHRVGPYPEDELPNWVIPLRRVAPNFGQPGGGWEAATDDAAYTFGVLPLA